MISWQCGQSSSLQLGDMQINGTTHCLDKHKIYQCLAVSALLCFLQALRLKSSHDVDIMLRNTFSDIKRSCLVAGLCIPVDIVPLWPFQCWAKNTCGGSPGQIF